MWTILETMAIYLCISQLLLMPSSPCVGGGSSTTHKPIHILLAHRGHYNLSFLFLFILEKKTLWALYAAFQGGYMLMPAIVEATCVDNI